MRGVRINSAHVSPAAMAGMVRTIRSTVPRVTVLVDTKGSELRTTALASGLDEIALTEGSTVLLSASAGDTDINCIRFNGINPGRHLSPGTSVLLDDGTVRLSVVRSVDDDTVECTVAEGGALGSRKSLSIDAEIPLLPAVSDRDRENIRAAVAAGVDIIAHSFVRCAADIEQVREVVGDPKVKVFAKIECRAALDNLASIAAVSDGLLVARGDLGAEISLPCVPAAQMTVVTEAQRRGIPVIIATQMLHSMTENPHPTRAEVSDIAFAVVQDANWLLLTGETAKGRYPAECVEVMAQTIVETEKCLKTL